MSLSDPIYDVDEVAIARERYRNRSQQVQTADEESAAASDASLSEELLAGVTRNSYVRAGGSLARLPGTARETEVIQNAFSSESAMGGVLALMELKANEPNLREGLPNKRYIHLATHGLVDQQRRCLFSALALTPPDPPQPPQGGVIDNRHRGRWLFATV